MFLTDNWVQVCFVLDFRNVVQLTETDLVGMVLKSCFIRHQLKILISSLNWFPVKIDKCSVRRSKVKSDCALHQTTHLLPT